VTIDAALTWAVSPGRSDAWHALRLRVVAGFARYLHALDPCATTSSGGCLASTTEKDHATG
jgi:hypothetical protein